MAPRVQEDGIQMTTTAIDKLVAQLTEASDAYYNGTPVLTDAQFDAQLDELRRLSPKHPFLSKIGAPAPSSGAWPKAAHTIPMFSLNKVQEAAELSAWVASISKDQAPGNFVVMDKLDGASIDLVYHDRRLVQAITRGDGREGEDVSRNVLMMKGCVRVLPPQLPNGDAMPSRVYVRAEIIVLHDDFKKWFPGESNPRSTANGTMKRQSNAEPCKHLTIKAYDLMPNGVSMSSKSEELRILDQMGFQLPRYAVCADQAEVERVYAEYIASVRKVIGYEIDGLVITIDRTDIREALGDQGGNPAGACAYKFPHEKRPTILRDIEWTVGASGRITPVAIFDAVVIGGASLERASLATVRQMEMLKLAPGTRIMVARRNDVIPRIEENLDLGIENDD